MPAEAEPRRLHRGSPTSASSTATSTAPCRRCGSRSPAGGTGESYAYVQSLLGGLELDRGNYGAAELAYRTALAVDRELRAGARRPRQGRGRDAATSTPRSSATASWSSACRCPSTRSRSPRPSWPPGRESGRPAATSALVEVEARLLRAAGVDVDVELALYEADHGEPDAARSSSAATAGDARPACARPMPTRGRSTAPGATRRRWRSRARRCGSAPATRTSSTTPG